MTTEREQIAELTAKVILLEESVASARHDQAKAEQHVAEVRGGLDKTMYDYERQAAVDLRKAIGVIAELTTALRREQGNYD